MLNGLTQVLLVLILVVDSLKNKVLRAGFEKKKKIQKKKIF